MSETVFILGAGASVCGGVPTMEHFVDKAEDLKKYKMISDLEAYNSVEEALSEMHKLYYKADIDIRNIETVLAIIEMGKTINSFFGFSTEKIEKISSFYRRYIREVIEKTAYIQLNPEGIRANDSHAAFASHIKNKIEKSRVNNPVSIITFNYDTLIEFALTNKSINVIYGISGEEISSDPINVINVFKLHGSINWRKCTSKTCNKITIIQPEVIDDNIDKIKKYLKLSGHYKCPHCGNDLDDDAEIIPPTWNKSGRPEFISHVWKMAAHELSDAENIFIIGYSLPESDVFFKHLFALGSYSVTAIRKFMVVNTEEEAISRIKRMIGKGVKGFIPHKGFFENFVQDLFKYNE